MPEQAYSILLATIFQEALIPLFFSFLQACRPSPHRDLQVQGDSVMQPPRILHTLKGKGGGHHSSHKTTPVYSKLALPMCSRHLPHLGGLAGLWETASWHLQMLRSHHPEPCTEASVVVARPSLALEDIQGSESLDLISRQPLALRDAEMQPYRALHGLQGDGGWGWPHKLSSWVLFAQHLSCQLVLPPTPSSQRPCRALRGWISASP